MADETPSPRPSLRNPSRPCTQPHMRPAPSPTGTAPAMAYGPPPPPPLLPPSILTPFYPLTQPHLLPAPSPTGTVLTYPSALIDPEQHQILISSHPANIGAAPAMAYGLPPPPPPLPPSLLTPFYPLTQPHLPPAPIPTGTVLTHPSAPIDPEQYQILISSHPANIAAAPAMAYGPPPPPPPPPLPVSLITPSYPLEHPVPHYAPGLVEIPVSIYGYEMLFHPPNAPSAPIEQQAPSVPIEQQPSSAPIEQQPSSAPIEQQPSSAPIEQQPRRERDVPSQDSNRRRESVRRELNVARRGEARVDHRESDARRRTVFGRDYNTVQTGKIAQEATGANRRVWVRRKEEGGVHQREKNERERTIFRRPRESTPTVQEAKEKAGVGQREKRVKAKEVVQTDRIPVDGARIDQIEHTAASIRNTVSRGIQAIVCNTISRGIQTRVGNTVSTGTQTSPERSPEKMIQQLLF